MEIPARQSPISNLLISSPTKREPTLHFDPTFRDDLLDDGLWRRAMADLRLPAPGRYGNLRVDREAVSRVPLFERQLTLPQPVLWTRLYEDEILWMSDTPQERLMMLLGTSGMSGRVLVAGGGLGMYPQLLRRYQPVTQVTVVERHPDVAAMLGTTLGQDPAISIVNSPFDSFIAEQKAGSFDGCYIDIHPTLDPRWIPELNRLRDACTEIVSGTLHIWGYGWMVRALVAGLEKEYIPLLRRGLRYDDDFGRSLQRELPDGWVEWDRERLRGWLNEYAWRIAWKVAW